MHGGHVVATLLALQLVAVCVAAAPTDPEQVVVDAKAFADHVAQDPGSVVRDPPGTVESLLNPQPDTPQDPAAPGDGGEPGFADRIRQAFDAQFMVAGLAAVLASALGLGGFALVTRYVSPKEALRNPQRAMLYGFVRGNPGVHLKKLSEEFSMKTSSILWHIRKLENAELVRSERANGYRVFYPTDGGVEIKKVSRAITALQNPNARSLYEAIEAKGATPAQLANRLSIHGGTVRWHLRKLKDFGLVEELPGEAGPTFLATPLGRKSLQTLLGASLPAPSAPALLALEA